MCGEGKDRNRGKGRGDNVLKSLILYFVLFQMTAKRSALL